MTLVEPGCLLEEKW